MEAFAGSTSYPCPERKRSFSLFREGIRKESMIAPFLKGKYM